MSETADKTYAVTSSNVAAGTPNSVAVINDGTGDRQIVVLGKGDGTTGLVDGSSSNPVTVTQGITLTALSAWNSGTSLNATQTIFTSSGCEAVLVQLTQTTTLTAGAVTFEASYDGSTWVTVTASQVMDPTSTTYAQISLPYTVQASTNKYFIISNNGWQGLRIKLSTQITGSGTVTPNYALLNYDPAHSVIAYNPTAANFKVDLSGTAANSTAIKTDGSAVTQPVSGTVTVQQSTASNLKMDLSGSAANSTAGLLSIKIDQTTPGTTNAHSISHIGSTAVSAGNGTSGNGVQRVTIASDSTGQVAPAANSTSTGATFNYQSALNATKVAVDASPGNLYGVHIFNGNTSGTTNSAPTFIQFFNKASASVTVGTTAPDFVMVVPAGGYIDNVFPIPITFGTALTVAATTTASGSTNPTNSIVANFWYK